MLHSLALKYEDIKNLALAKSNSAVIVTALILDADAVATQSTLYEKKNSAMMTVSPRWDSESFLCVLYALYATWHRLMLQAPRCLFFSFTIHLQIHPELFLFIYLFI